MAFKFNPFTGTLDQTGSGGGASYIDGEVQNFSALPETIGTPAVDSAYLVREAEGTWLLARKPAGIYIRTADTGVRAADWTHAGAFPDVFNDANFLLYDNSDSTKNLAFQLSGLTTGTTRTLTAPDASGTIALTSDFAAPPAIGSTTPNSAAFTSLSANNGTLTASAPVLDLAQTWNNAAVLFTGAQIAITDTASNTDSELLTLKRNATTVFRFRKSGQIVAASTMTLTATGGNVIVNGNLNIGSSNLTLAQDAADTLAQRRSTNPQTFRLYNTYTDASNHERGFMRWSSNVLQIGTEAGGTGSARALEFQTNGVTRVTISTAGTLTTTASIVAGNNVGAAGTGNFSLAGRLLIRSTANASAYFSGVGSQDSNFDLLGFGGTTSSFPALKRDTTTLQVKLADDSAFAAIQGKLTTETAYTAGAPTATGYLVLYDSAGTAYKVPAEAL
jgi:hypothetical protein